METFARRGDPGEEFGRGNRRERAVVDSRPNAGLARARERVVSDDARAAAPFEVGRRARRGAGEFACVAVKKG